MKINAKGLMVFSVVVGVVFAGAAVYGFDWFGLGKGKELRAPVPGAQAVINKQREELRNLLIDAYSRNITVKNSLADSNWQNFLLRDYANPATPTGRLRNVVERNLEGLFTTYKALLRTHAADFDRILTKRDGTPYAPGDFMREMWTGWPESEDYVCEDDLSMSREDILSEIMAQHCGAPQAKWIIYFKDNILVQVAEFVSTAEADDTIGDVWSTYRRDDWAVRQQRWSGSFDTYANVFKRVYEAPGMFGSPIPPKIEAVYPTLDPMRPE